MPTPDIGPPAVQIPRNTTRDVQQAIENILAHLGALKSEISALQTAGSSTTSTAGTPGAPGPPGTPGAPGTPGTPGAAGSAGANAPLLLMEALEEATEPIPLPGRPGNDGADGLPSPLALDPDTPDEPLLIRGMTGASGLDAPRVPLALDPEDPAEPMLFPGVPGPTGPANLNLLIKVYNDTGSTITKGTPVYVTGNNSPNQLPTIGLARADVDATAHVLGLTNEDIANSSSGYVCGEGDVTGIDTTAWNAGQLLYLSDVTAGAMTATNAQAIRYGVRCAVVTFRNLSAGVLTVLAGKEATRSIADIIDADLSTPSRTLNSNFTPNATRATLCVYSVRITTTGSLTITGGSTQTGRVELRSDNSATPSTTRCQIEGSAGLTGTVVVGVAINNTDIVEAVLIHIVPPGQKVRLVTTNVTGTPTFSITGSSEVSL